MVLYDPEMAFIREIRSLPCNATNRDAFRDLFHALRQYRATAYLSEIHKEKKSFETLIYQKAHLMMPANVTDVPVPRQGGPAADASVQYGHADVSVDLTSETDPAWGRCGRRRA